MKKSLIPVFLLIVILFGFGCAKKTDNATIDSASAAPSSAPGYVKGGTSQIMPPANTKPNDPILVTTQTGASPDVINFQETTIVGAQDQTVWLTGSSSGDFILTAAIRNRAQNAPVNPPNTPILVQPKKADGSAYTIPVTNPGPNQYTYSDGTNSVTITIVDNNVPAGATGSTGK